MVRLGIRQSCIWTYREKQKQKNVHLLNRNSRRRSDIKSGKFVVRLLFALKIGKSRTSFSCVGFYGTLSPIPANGGRWDAGDGLAMQPLDERVELFLEFFQ